MDCSMPGSSVLHCILEFTQIHVPPVGDAIQPSHPLSPASLAFIFPSIRVFPGIRLFASGGQSAGASLSISVLPVNIQG